MRDAEGNPVCEICDGVMPYCSYTSVACPHCGAEHSYEEALVIVIDDEMKESVKGILLARKAGRPVSGPETGDLHSCSIHCKNPACVMRRERDAWRTCAESAMRELAANAVYPKAVMAEYEKLKGTKDL